MRSHFLSRLTEIIADVSDSQDETLASVAAEMAGTLAAGHLVHLYGSGHSVIPTLDAFPRYGSFAGLNPLNDPRLMWHNVLGPGGVKELLWLERVEGYTENFLAHEPLHASDMLVVFSHGGRNAAPVEAAQYGRSLGMRVVAVTSSASMSSPATHTSGKRLSDHADFLIDTRVPLEDAVLQIEGWDRPVGGASTIVATAIMHELICRTADALARQGVELPTFVSPTVPGCSVESNDAVFEAHAEGLVAARQRVKPSH